MFTDNYLFLQHAKRVVVCKHLLHSLLLFMDFSVKCRCTVVHIWACPPPEGNDYIFDCHCIVCFFLYTLMLTVGTQWRTPWPERWWLHLPLSVLNLLLFIYINVNYRCTVAHIWACPPSEGDYYIFHCHCIVCFCLYTLMLTVGTQWRTSGPVLPQKAMTTSSTVTLLSRRYLSPNAYKNGTKRCLTKASLRG